MGVEAGLFALFLADEAVEDVEGVEKEVGIDLSLELEVSVLRHVCLLSFIKHFASCGYCVVHYVDKAICHEFNYERDYEKKDELLVFESGEEGHKKGSQGHECHIKSDGS